MGQVTRLVAAIIGRVTFNAHIIETGTESFRLRATKPSPDQDVSAEVFP